MLHRPDVPLHLTDEALLRLRPVPLQDTTLVTRRRGAPDGERGAEAAGAPDTIRLSLTPSPGSPFLLIQDIVLIEIIVGNEWSRPIYFTYPPDLVRRYARLEGLVWRLAPEDSASLDREMLRKNLFDRYRYRGYADASVPMDRIETPPHMKEAVERLCR